MGIWKKLIGNKNVTSVKKSSKLKPPLKGEIILSEQIGNGKFRNIYARGYKNSKPYQRKIGRIDLTNKKDMKNFVRWEKKYNVLLEFHDVKYFKKMFEELEKDFKK